MCNIDIVYTYNVKSVLKVTGFASAWYSQNLDLTYFQFFCPSKVTRTCSKQPTDFGGDF